MVYTKGGVDEVLAKCVNFEKENYKEKSDEEYKKEIYTQNEEMAKNALRLLACAYKELDNKQT